MPMRSLCPLTRTLSLALLALLLLLPAAGSAAELKLGVIGPMTGSLAEHGQNLRRAAEYAVEKVNAAGGVEAGGTKYSIKLVFGDDEGLMAERAVAATQRLIEQEQVAGIIGWAISSQLLAAMPIIQQAKVPTINTVGKAGSIPERIAREKMDYLFQLSPTNDDLVRSHGRVITHYVKPKKIALVMINSDVSRDYDQRARAQWPKTMPGVEFLTMFVESDRQDFQPELLRLRQFGPDLVYVLFVGAHSYAWADQFAASRLGRTMIVFGDSEYGDPVFLQKTGAATDLHLANAVTFEAPITELTMPFFQGYKAKYNVGAPYHSVQTYDGVLMMLEGIRRAGKLTGRVAEDRVAIKAGLEKITKERPVTGARGSLFFSPIEDGRRVPAEVAVVQFQGGKRVLVWPLGPAAGQFVDPRKR